MSHSRAITNNLNKLRLDPSLPSGLRTAVSTVLIHHERQGTPMVAPSGKLPSQDRNDLLRAMDPWTVAEPTLVDLVNEFNTQSDQATRAGPQQPTSSVSEAAIDVLASLPVEILIMIFDAYATETGTSAGVLRQVNRQLAALSRAQRVGLTDPQVPSAIRDELTVTPLSACLVGLLYVTINRALPRLQEPTEPYPDFTSERSLWGEEGSRDLPFTWNTLRDRAGLARRISLGVAIGGALSHPFDEYASHVAWRDFMSLRFDSVNDPGVVEFDALAVESPQFGDVSKHVQSIDDYPLWTAIEALLLLDSSVYRKFQFFSGAPNLIPWPHGFSATAYGRCRDRLLMQTNWHEQVSLFVEEQSVGGDSQLVVCPYYNVSDSDRNTQRDAPWRKEQVLLEMARCVDETAQVSIVGYTLDPANPKHILVHGLRTSLCQAALSVGELRHASLERTYQIEQAYLDAKSYVSPYWSSIGGSVPVWLLSAAGKYRKGFDSALDPARSIRETLNELLALCPDPDIAKDIASCITISVNSVFRRIIATHTLKRPDSDTLQDWSQPIHIDIVLDNLGRFKDVYDDAQLAELWDTQGMHLWYHNIDINRTKLYRLLARHETSTVVGGCKQWWAALLPLIRDKGSPIT